MYAKNIDYTVVPIFTEQLSEKKTKSNLRRWWNQLSSLQRSIILMLFFILTFAIFYLGVGASYYNLKTEQAKLISNNVIKKYTKEHTLTSDSKAQMPMVSVSHVAESRNKDQRKFDGSVTQRQKAVIHAFKHAWKGYKKFAWGHDHLKPISESYHDWFGLGLTIVDSLDTMLIMGLKEEFNDARNWVVNHLDFDQDRDVNLFEVTIRILGGLLSAYHFSSDEMFLKKSIDLGNRLLPSFKSESGIPFSDINLATSMSHGPRWSPDSSTSEVATLQLEFTDLSRSCSDARFETVASKVSEHIHYLEKKDGLVPIYINTATGNFRSYATITLGARGDSYYEYLLKQWIQTGKQKDYLKNDYLEAIDGIQKHLVRRTFPNKYLFIGELLSGKEFKPKMDHLTCYLPGTLALGVHHGLPSKHMEFAMDLLHTCYQTYAQQPTFLAPEITYFNIQPNGQQKDFYVKPSDAHNLLRPEFIESLWYMYQITGNTTYQDWGWHIFEAIEKYTKVANGYTSIDNVKNPSNVNHRDMMESFFLSETLKYFYLLFSDNPKLIDIDQYVMNSEAHPFPILPF